MSEKSAGTVARTAATMAVAFMAIGGAAMVHAQDESQGDTNERLRACDEMAGTMEKLACFDAVVKSLDQTPSVPTVETSAAPAPADDAAASSIPVVATSAAAAAIATDHPVEVKSAVPESSPKATGKPDESVASTASAEEAFGLGDTQAREEERKLEEDRERAAQEAGNAQGDEIVESIQATVVSSWSTIDDRFETLLDNGQVWRETAATPRRTRLPREGASVVISRGLLGSFRMKIGNDNRLAAVRRTK